MEPDLPSRWSQRLQQGNLPGRAAQAKFEAQLSYGRHFGPAPDDARRAAVMMLLFPDGDDWRLPLVLRPLSLAAHGGQIGLPGGAVDPGESSDQAALRELMEELGVPADGVQLLGQLTQLYVYGTHFLVTPWLAWTAVRPTFVPSSAEVDEVLEVSLAQLGDPSLAGIFHREIRGITFSAPCISLGEHCLWGATAMMLAELVELVELVSRAQGTGNRG